MDEEITIIDAKTRNEKIKSFFLENKKLIISISVFLILISFIFYSYSLYKEGHRELLANKYNNAVIEYENGNKSKVIASMKEVVEDKDRTYSPLGLYFLIDNDLLESEDQTNSLFDIIINEVDLEEEIRNLVIYKKALFNSNFAEENELISILNPIINSKSIWKSHALYLMAEYYYSKKENQKAKEFFNQIILLPSSNSKIKTQSQKRLNRDLSE